ncbi:MAG: transposase [Phycisphaeraceae bacterium]|nr:transposase [Phycisphaeraceae bacterium]
MRQKLAAWRIDYNEHRPHSVLGNLAPSESASSQMAYETSKQSCHHHRRN